jgi:hypothetical protein
MSSYHKPMPFNIEDGALWRQQRKPVKKSRLLSAMKSTDGFALNGPGTFETVKFGGRDAIKITAPTTPETGTGPRRYAVTTLKLPVEREDWREYNRISAWVYAVCPGFGNVWVGFSLSNDGEVKYPRPDRFEGVHHFNIKPGKWTLFTWEIPYIYRDAVTELCFSTDDHGSLPEMANTQILYISEWRLDEVEPDHYRGWGLDGRIAYCHSGYKTGTPKKAFAQLKAANFSLIDNTTGKTVYTGDTTESTTSIGSYTIMDFSGFDTEGVYTLKLGDTETKPFRINGFPFKPAIEKTINFFYLERCGQYIEGIHSPCHIDCFSEHPDGRRVSAAGGWHDAGDLSQGLVNTSESVSAMLDTAVRLKKDNPALFERLLEEAHWGLDWMLKTRFGDGYRTTWITLGIWSKNIIGDKDDIIQAAADTAMENFCAAAAEALAATVYAESEPGFSEVCKNAGAADFDFAMKAFDEGRFGSATGTPLYGQAGYAALMLYDATRDEKYIEIARNFADRVTACQQSEIPDWDIPVRGFIYTDEKHELTLASDHRSHEQAPLMLLVNLCLRRPKDSEYGKWENAVKLYGEYLLSIEQYTAPYGVMCAGIYETEQYDQRRRNRSADLAVTQKNRDDYEAQLRNGVKLSDRYYLRRFPVAFQFRGFHGTMLTKAKAASMANKLLKNNEIDAMIRRQIEWVLGANPFAQSTMYGEGYDFVELYSEFGMDMVGELPVGIETFENDDAPFYPDTNHCTYKEIWVHSSSRFLWVLADIV